MAKRRPRFDSLEQRLCLTSGPVLQTTFSLPQGSWTPTVYRASPIYAVINGQNDLIVAASGAELIAYADNPNGTASAVVTYKTPAGTIADIKATPIVVTDPTTGQQDLFAAMGRNEEAGQTTNSGPVIEDGRVFGWNLATGALLPGFANGVSTGSQPNGDTGVYGALTSGNLQGNGIPDLVVTSFSHEVTAITLQGTILWQWDNDDSIISGAVVADIGRDGTPDVIVGGDSSQSINSAVDNFQNGGWVNVLSNTGQLLWRRQLPGEVTWSSPVVADLLNNGNLDIVIGTGVNFSASLGGAYTAAGDYIYAFDPSGNMLPGWPYHTTTSTSPDQAHEVLGPPVVADLTGNGQLDVIAIDRAGYLHVVQPNGQDLPGFVGGKRIDPTVTQAQTPDDYASPTIADVTGNGVPDIIATAGPFINAFDPQGNIINIGTTPVGTGKLNEGVDIAPAVGNFDGTGGLCMAVVTYDALNPISPNVPDKVQIYQLPVSTLTPPWPMLRRTATGDAVMRSPVYDQQYVAQAFTTLMGGLPSIATAVPYIVALNNDSINLLSTAQLIASSLPVQDVEIAKIYQSFLGSTTNAFIDSYWTTYLQSHTLRQMEEAVTSSAQFAMYANGSESQEITIIYQAILSRTPGQAEINAWIATKLPITSIAAAIINSSEAITDQFNTIVQAMFGKNTQSLIPPDDEPAFSLDVHAGVSEAEMTSEMLVSAGNYAATNFVAGYVANLYRDVLNRVGSAPEIAGVLTAVDNGSIAFGNLASFFLNSTEAKDDYVELEYTTLLGIVPSASTVSALAALPTREDVVIYIVGSPLFFADSGGTNKSFVNAAYIVLGYPAPTQSTIDFVAGQITAGVSTTTSVAANIIYSTPLYFTNLVISELEFFIPLESQGLLRTGELPANAPGQPINPQPNLINYFLALYEGGESDVQVISTMLNTPQYYTEAAFYRGLYRSPGVRY